LVERPGTGLSDPHAYDAVADWAADMAHVADALGAERMGVVGLSGGGPYALACGAVPPVSGRVAAVGVLGGVVPSFGFDAAATGVIDMTRRFAPLLSGLRRPLATMVAGLVLPVIPFGRYAYRGYASIMPKGDQKVFADSEMEGMFLDDLALLAKGRFQAFVDDIRLFGRDWGFRLADVKVPVRWWHGDADPIVPRAPPRRRPRTCPTPNSSWPSRRLRHRRRGPALSRLAPLSLILAAHSGPQSVEQNGGVIGAVLPAIGTKVINATGRLSLRRGL
jgi:pimeloyl-ACP methyl ester carboxylesterase